MSANIPLNGPAAQLDGRADPDENVTPEDAKDADRVSRLLSRILRDLARITRLWRPRRLDFEGRVVLGDGTTKYRYEHRFGGRVRFWPVEWVGAAAPNLRKDDASTLDTLVLTSTSAGTMTLRVEESG